jgi:hypothetical protein
MSRDFLLVLGGGLVSLVTTFVVLFVTDWVYRHDHGRSSDRQQPSESQGVDRGEGEMNTQTAP